MPGGSDGCNQQISQIIPYFSGILSLLATILLPNAASMIWAARSSVPWIRWPYTLSVIVGELCPRRRETIPLQPGMLLSADIVFDRRSLIRWLFDPVFAVANRS